MSKRAIRFGFYLVLFLIARFVWFLLPSSPNSIKKSNFDYNWGSIQHHLQNYPTPSTLRTPLPYSHSKDYGNSQIRVWVVTSELEGLNQNGGIGTAFMELALDLSKGSAFQVSILVAHPRNDYTVRQLELVGDKLGGQNISLHFLDSSKIPMYPVGWTPHASIGVLRYLQGYQHDIDFIHFSENTGIGYFTVLSKFQGLAFQHCQIIVGLHGAEVEWASMLNRVYPSDRYRMELGYFERRTAELADIIISPSDYMVDYVQKRGWKLPSSTYVIPNIVQASPIEWRREIGKIKELVFFGRLEERKGVRLFVQALELLFLDNTSAIEIDTITFLGRDFFDSKTNSLSSTLITAALGKLQDNAPNQFVFQFKSDLDRPAALDYLRDSSRLAVIPPIADNSPSTILECITSDIAFVTSNVGGISELIHPDDHSRVLFPPFPSSLARQIEQVVSNSTVKIRQSQATINAAQDWVQLHKYLLDRFQAPPVPISRNPKVSVIITHFDRPDLVVQLLESLQHQEYTNFELILVDDGSIREESLNLLRILDVEFQSRVGWSIIRIKNSYLGEARNIGAANSTGEYILFLDDDDVLKSDALLTLVSVAEKTNASALSSWLDEFASDQNPLNLDSIPHRRTYYFAGQSISLGMIENCFGSGNIFVKRRIFEELGGFTTLRELGGEDWEFWMKLALAGHSHYVVPVELIFVRSDPRSSSMKYSMDRWDTAYRALTPILNDARVQELGLAPALMLLQASLSKSPSPPSFVNSKLDFQLIQGWNGWTYAFEPVDVERGSKEFDGVAGEFQWSNERNRYLPPYITESSQHPFVSSTGKIITAVRRFQTPKAMDVSIRLEYSTSHQCGDGTELQLLHQSFDNISSQTLLSRNTMDVSQETFEQEMHLEKGDILLVVSHPLTNSDCDHVEVQLVITRSALGNLAWSDIERKEQAMNRQENSIPPVDDQIWTAVVEPVIDPDTEFHLVLIFDQHRFQHAKQVIRSAVHFLKSRTLHFHLLAPLDLHQQIRLEFLDSPVILSTYDHSHCYSYAREVLPFSDPSIHISAHCKFFLAEILSQDRVLYLDTDTTIISDITECYSKPLLPKALISMAVDFGDACQLSPDYCWPIGMHWKPRNGSLETFQVNGGIILMELAKMREESFVSKYVQSIIHHYRSVGVVARWGEQDFINSYFRIHPQELEVLPCGCNYQWFAARRDVKCGGYPIRIAHAWSHGIAARSSNPFNQLFHHFLDDIDDSKLPVVDLISPVTALSENSISIQSNFNCPLQSHDCSNPVRTLPYGEIVNIISILEMDSIFTSDLIDSISSQIYPYITHLVSKPSTLSLRTTDVYRYDLESTSTLQQDSARNELEELAKGWILYLNDDRLFASTSSLAHLMARIDHKDQLLTFRSNNSDHNEVKWFKKKSFGQESLDSLGFLFHSDHLELINPSSRQGGLASKFEALSQRLSIKWIDLVPTISHPLLHHLPQRLLSDFKVSIFLFETSSRPSWLSKSLELLKAPAFANLIEEIIVVSEEREAGSLGEGVLVLNLTPGFGMMELAGISRTAGVLLLSDSIFISKDALIAMINHWLENPTRVVGPFVSDPLEHDSNLFDYPDESDIFLGQESYTGVSSRLLLTHSSNFDQLAQLLDLVDLHPSCHTQLINRISHSQSKLKPLRLILPEASLVDRVKDCRMRNWNDVSYDAVYGDYDTDGESIPSYQDCSEIIEEQFSFSEQRSNEVGVTGTLGTMEGVGPGGEISEGRWKAVRREGECLRN